MDVMPNCAAVIVGKLRDGEEWPAKPGRHWRAKRDFCDGTALLAHRQEKAAKAFGQCVKTFVSDEWTLEYDLALGPKDETGQFHHGLAKDIFVAAWLADNDDALNAKTKTVADEAAAAIKAFAAMRETAKPADGCTVEEVVASTVYARFEKDGVSKPVAAQYLADRLRYLRKVAQLEPEHLRAVLPEYLVEAIEYVTGGKADIAMPTRKLATNV